MRERACFEKFPLGKRDNRMGMLWNRDKGIGI